MYLLWWRNQANIILTFKLNLTPPPKKKKKKKKKKKEKQRKKNKEWSKPMWLFCTSGPNLVILAWMGHKIFRRQTHRSMDRQTHVGNGCFFVLRQAQRAWYARPMSTLSGVAMAIWFESGLRQYLTKGQNWSRVKIQHFEWMLCMALTWLHDASPRNRGKDYSATMTSHSNNDVIIASCGCWEGGVIEGGRDRNCIRKAVIRSTAHQPNLTTTTAC